MAYRASIVKSLQTGTITLAGVASNTATITAVVLINAVLRTAGATLGNGTDSTGNATSIDKTSTTVITATKTLATGTVVASYTMVEYFPNILKSNQDFNIAMTATVLSGTATITAVTVAKTDLAVRGNKLVTSTFDETQWNGRLEVTSTTVITGTRGGGAGTCTLYGSAVEFK